MRPATSKGSERRYKPPQRALRKAQGVVMHKIDRSARNLKDWSDLGELIDQGVEVYFANEALDLHSRGGRLSADIQAVVAADYIRNLREEVKKGFYGRLKQGVYPLPAPLGYMNQGKAKPKVIDPVKGPLVRKLFELYSSGDYSLDRLTKEMNRRGLCNRRGGKITRNTLSVILNDPFYVGIIKIRTTGETFEGAHETLISKTLYDRARMVLRGKIKSKGWRHEFLFRRLLRCKHCQRVLTAERQKGHVYYRCHTSGCPTKGVREETVEEQVKRTLALIGFSAQELVYLHQKLGHIRSDWGQESERQIQAIVMRQGQVKERLGRLTDAFLDGHLDKNLFEERKNALLMERKEMEERSERLTVAESSMPDQLVEFFELASNALLSYEMGIPDEKRELLANVTSNRWVDGNNVELELSFPFCQMAQRAQNDYSASQRDSSRTGAHLDRILSQLVAWVKRGGAPLLKRLINDP